MWNFPSGLINRAPTIEGWFPSQDLLLWMVYEAYTGTRREGYKCLDCKVTGPVVVAGNYTTISVDTLDDGNVPVPASALHTCLQDNDRRNNGLAGYHPVIVICTLSPLISIPQPGNPVACQSFVTPVRPVSTLTIEEAAWTTKTITNRTATATHVGRSSRDTSIRLTTTWIIPVLCHCCGSSCLLSNHVSIVAFRIDNIHSTGATSNQFK